jgi:antirestriction protein ArdC
VDAKLATAFAEKPDLPKRISRNKRPASLDGREEVEAFIETIEANVIHGNTRAYYLPKFDQIHLPDPEDFKTMVDYYAVSLHEHTHWTGHESRLNRPLVLTAGGQP